MCQQSQIGWCTGGEERFWRKKGWLCGKYRLFQIVQSLRVSAEEFFRVRLHTAGDEMLHMLIAAPIYEVYVEGVCPKQVSIGGI